MPNRVADLALGGSNTIHTAAQAAARPRVVAVRVAARIAVVVAVRVVGAVAERNAGTSGRRSCYCWPINPCMVTRLCKR
jgi:hypothetical protein